MIELIKSKYLVYNLFSLIYEGKKLKMINYNKSLQNLLDISLINYRIYSGRYRIIEKNGNGKEYDGYNGELIFEGVYLNGKRNGKGKEYNKNNGKLSFEGEYLNGKINGKGK